MIRKKRQAVNRFTSAVGSTINLAMTYRSIYVPTFQSVNLQNDDQVKVTLLLIKDVISRTNTYLY